MNYPLARLFASVLVMSWLTACADNDNNNNPKQGDYSPISAATVSVPPDEGSLNLLAQSFDLNSIAYEDVEFFISGTASAFTNVNELTDDGQWTVEAGEQAQYQTRLVVHRPLNASQFSGTVTVV